MTIHPISPKSQYFSLSLRWHEASSIETQERVWDAFIARCATRAIYIGGTSEQAILVTRRNSAHTRVSVSGWLTKQSAVAAFIVAPVAPHSGALQVFGRASAGLAFIEAIAGYQQHLLEELQWTVEQFPRICVP